MGCHASYAAVHPIVDSPRTGIGDCPSSPGLSTLPNVEGSPHLASLQFLEKLPWTVSEGSSTITGSVDRADTQQTPTTSNSGSMYCWGVRYPPDRYPADRYPKWTDPVVYLQPAHNGRRVHG